MLRPLQCKHCSSSTKKLEFNSPDLESGQACDLLGKCKEEVACVCSLTGHQEAFSTSSVFLRTLLSQWEHTMLILNEEWSPCELVLSQPRSRHKRAKQEPEIDGGFTYKVHGTSRLSIQEQPSKPVNHELIYSCYCKLFKSKVVCIQQKLSDWFSKQVIFTRCSCV